MLGTVVGTTGCVVLSEGALQVRLHLVHYGVTDNFHNVLSFEDALSCAFLWHFPHESC